MVLTGREWLHRVETRPSRFAPAGECLCVKAVIYRLKQRHLPPCQFQRFRWSPDRQKNILVHEGLPLLGAEDDRMDVAAWLQGLGLERYVQAFRDNEIDWDALPKLSAPRS